MNFYHHNLGPNQPNNLPTLLYLNAQYESDLFTLSVSLLDLIQVWKSFKSFVGSVVGALMNEVVVYQHAVMW